MLKYRINTRKLNKTRIELQLNKISFVDFENLIDEEDESVIEYDGLNKKRLLVTCECYDIDKIKNGSTIQVTNTLYLDYGITDMPYQDKFVFNSDYTVIGVNNGNKSFSFYIDKYFTLNPIKITTGENNENNVYITFEESHYFDVTDNIINDETKEQKIPVYFRYVNVDGERVENTIMFKWYSPEVLVASYDDFETEEQKELYRLIFGSEITEDSANNEFVYVRSDDEEIKITEAQYAELEDEKKQFYSVNVNEKEGDLSAFQVYRDNFLFTEKTNYEFSFERPLTEINVPITNTFETNLMQMELLNEQFVDAEKKKAINRITDIEKDVYYPCISNQNKNAFTDVYIIKFNLHFREHRGDDWLVENESFWNCVTQDFVYVNKYNEEDVIQREDYEELEEEDKENYFKSPLQGTAEIVKVDDVPLTTDNCSDLLSFLNFTNEDVRYQKNKLKKSFLRLSFYDSMNPGNQNMIAYSTIFFDTGKLFTKFAKYFEDGEYVIDGANKREYGEYSPLLDKVGIRVDRESFDDDTRLSSQIIVKSKNMSKASSEGFYLYIWKDNHSPLPQDLYMKVEFNHAGYGRTIPFMMPYWDMQKWADKSGIKTFEEILKDWNDKPSSTQPIDAQKRIRWTNNTDGHYGIKQYTKFSYIHLKYQYDKETDKHIYYLDPDTYGNSVTKQKDAGGNEINEIVINLYEAKIGE